VTRRRGSATGAATIAGPAECALNRLNCRGLVGRQCPSKRRLQKSRSGARDSASARAFSHRVGGRTGRSQ
jgi:hypothetical protein